MLGELCNLGTRQKVLSLFQYWPRNRDSEDKNNNFFVQKGDVLAAEVLPRIIIAEGICEASERKKGKQDHKTCCPYNVVLLTKSMGVFVLTTTQATGQQKYQIKFTIDKLKSNGKKKQTSNKQRKNKFICFHTTIH